MLKRHFLFLLIVVLAIGLFNVSCKPAYEYKGTLFDPPRPVPDFELTAANGAPFRLNDLDEGVTLVYFGYTFCPDVCPLTLADVQIALADLAPAERERIHLLFISADPERDTPEVLARYLAAFDPTFIGLTGDFEQIKTIMKPFGAYAEKEAVTGSAVGYLVSHTARLYLLNTKREILLTYPFGFETGDLQSDLAHLLR